MERLKDKVFGVVEEVLAREGCELVDMAVSVYKNNTTIRVFVYEDGGVSIERCGQLSRIIGDVLDGTDLLDKGYVLEVSSPGLDRPLTSTRDFRYRVGETVRIEFVDHARKKETAEILSATSDTVRFRNEGGEFEIVMDEIEAAKIVF